jgi:hypothetical protein
MKILTTVLLLSLTQTPFPVNPYTQQPLPLQMKIAITGDGPINNIIVPVKYSTNTQGSFHLAGIPETVGAQQGPGWFGESNGVYVRLWQSGNDIVCQVNTKAVAASSGCQQLNGQIGWKVSGVGLGNMEVSVRGK